MVPRYSVLDSCICLFITNARYEKNVMRGNVSMSWHNVGQTHLSLIDLTWSGNIEQVGSRCSMNICRSDIDLTWSGRIKRFHEHMSIRYRFDLIRQYWTAFRSDQEVPWTYVDQISIWTGYWSEQEDLWDIDLTWSGKIEQVIDWIKRIFQISFWLIRFKFVHMTNANLVWIEQQSKFNFVCFRGFSTNTRFDFICKNGCVLVVN